MALRGLAAWCAGFVSVGPRSPSTNGTLVTKQFAVPSGSLWINADVTQRCDPSACGTTTLQITAVSGGKRVAAAPIVATASVPVSGQLPATPPNATALGDYRELKVRWPTSPAGAGAQMHLEFAMQGGGQLYSYWFA